MTGMRIVAPINSGGSERGYRFDTMLVVKEQNPRIVYGKEST